MPIQDLPDLHWCVSGAEQVGKLFENNGLVSVEQDAIFDMQANGARQHNFFEVATGFHKIFYGVAMRNAGDALLDDWSVVEDFGDIVSGSPDELHAAIKGLLVGLGADKGGQERVVNIDDLLGILVNELAGKHLHVAGQHDQFNVVIAKQLDLLALRFRLVFFGYGNYMIGDSVEVRVALGIRMVADHQRNFAG